MHKLQKIRAHIKMLEFEQTKFTKLLEEEIANPHPSRPQRRGDIERALKRCTSQVELWRDKLSKFENLPPRAPDRGSVLDSDPGRPLIG